MSAVEIKELRDKLRHYLKRVKRGEWIETPNRGKVIALLSPAGKAADEGVWRLAREGLAS